jgi:uncharacterized membrane protein YeaQ/YmgE (transglycosylase-associated protein family)
MLGLIAGLLASKIVNRSGSGFGVDMILGIAGAVVGGWIFSFFGKTGVTGLNLYSILVAVLGSVLVLSLFHMFRRA